MTLRVALLILLAAATAVCAQFPLWITKPRDGEMIKLGTTIPVDVVTNVPSETGSPDIRFFLCTYITAVPLCNHTYGTVLLDAPYRPPEQSYNVTVPANQPPGVTALLVAHVTTVNGVVTLNDNTSIAINLHNIKGNRQTVLSKQDSKL